MSKDEILKSNISGFGIENLKEFNDLDGVLEAMQEYANQQTKGLQQKIEQLQFELKAADSDYHYKTKELQENLYKQSTRADILQDENVKLQAKIDELVTMLSSIHDIVDKQNFEDDSQLAEIYKITHNSF